MLRPDFTRGTQLNNSSAKEWAFADGGMSDAMSLFLSSEGEVASLTAHMIFKRLETVETNSPIKL